VSSGVLRLSALILIAVSTLAQRGSAQTPADPETQKLERLFTALRNRNERDYAVTGANAIDDSRYVEIGGIEQWITIRGEDRRNPVVLFLHGGPGDATNPWGYITFRSWLKAFTVVQWDQRGAGRTLGKNGAASASSITVARMAQDGIELTEFLRKTLHKEKVIVVGHSFGSILGVLMVKSRPDLFYAFVGTGQVADPVRNYAVAYNELIKKAEALGDQTALRELRDIGPPPYSDGRGFAVQRKWSNLFEHADAFLGSMFGLALQTPGYTLKDVNDWIDGQGLSAQRLVPETNALDTKQLAGDFATPVFVIQGAEDFTTPTSLARAFVDSLHAPRKIFVPIEGGHFAVFIKSDLFLKEMVARVRPLAATR
jgi:pimeloyl-ACP methyl ester carboxylesterase